MAAKPPSNIPSHCSPTQQSKKEKNVNLKGNKLKMMEQETRTQESPLKDNKCLSNRSNKPIR